MIIFSNYFTADNRSRLEFLLDTKLQNRVSIYAARIGTLQPALWSTHMPLVSWC